MWTQQAAAWTRRCRAGGLVGLGRPQGAEPGELRPGLVTDPQDRSGQGGEPGIVGQLLDRLVQEVDDLVGAAEGEGGAQLPRRGRHHRLAEPEEQRKRQRRG